MDKLDQRTREDLPFTDEPDSIQDSGPSLQDRAERAVIEASRRLYDADLRCQRVGKAVDYMAMRRAENAKARAVEEWRQAMRALRETDPK